MNGLIFVLYILVICAVHGKPSAKTEYEPTLDLLREHRIAKRFINPSMTSGGFSGTGLSKIRAKRDLDEECEKLRLCKLHARSNRNFIAAFQLYFVNKENARLWDHHEHSAAECEQRYSCYR